MNVINMCWLFRSFFHFLLKLVLFWKDYLLRLNRLLVLFRYFRHNLLTLVINFLILRGISWLIFIRLIVIITLPISSYLWHPLLSWLLLIVASLLSLLTVWFIRLLQALFMLRVFVMYLLLLVELVHIILEVFFNTVSHIWFNISIFRVFIFELLLFVAFVVLLKLNFFRGHGIRLVILTIPFITSFTFQYIHLWSFFSWIRIFGLVILTIIRTIFIRFSFLLLIYMLLNPVVHEELRVLIACILVNEFHVINFCLGIFFCMFSPIIVVLKDLSEKIDRSILTIGT